MKYVKMRESPPFNPFAGGTVFNHGPAAVRLREQQPPSRRETLSRGISPVRPERTRFGKNFTVWICGLYHRPKPFPSGCRSGSFITGTGRRPTLRKDWSTSGAIRPFSTAAICSRTITASRSGTSSCLPNTAGGTWSTNPAAPRNRGATGSSFPRRRANTAITSCCTGSESPRPASSPSGKAAAFST